MVFIMLTALSDLSRLHVLCQIQCIHDGKRKVRPVRLCEISKENATTRGNIKNWMLRRCQKRCREKVLNNILETSYGDTLNIVIIRATLAFCSRLKCIVAWHRLLGVKNTGVTLKYAAVLEHPWFCYDL